MSIISALEDWNHWWFSKKVDERFIGIKRDLLSEIKEYIDIPKAKVIVGVRRSGKSTLLYQIIDYLLRNKIAKPNEILFINFDDARFSVTNVEDIYNKYLEIMKPNKVFIFLDEVHKAKSWVSLIRRLLDLRKGEVFITDSCSYYIPTDYSRVLTGRKIEMDLYPFSFSEYLRLKGVKIKGFGTEERGLLRGYLRDYINYGGFPEVNIYQKMWKKILIEYFEDIITKDIVSRFNANYQKVLDLSYYLISNVGQRITNRKLRSILGLGLETIERYLTYLEQVYLIFKVNRYSPKVKEQIITPKKVYAIDTGMVNVLGFKISDNFGPIFENIIFLNLKRSGYKIFYAIVDGGEIDFLICKNNRILGLINVSYTMENEKTRKREVNSLIKGMKLFGVNRAFIITWDEEDKINVKNKQILIVPAYKWILEQERFIQ